MPDQYPRSIFFPLRWHRWCSRCVPASMRLTQCDPDERASEISPWSPTGHVRSIEGILRWQSHCRTHRCQQDIDALLLSHKHIQSGWSALSRKNQFWSDESSYEPPYSLTSYHLNAAICLLFYKLLWTEGHFLIRFYHFSLIHQGMMTLTYQQSRREMTKILTDRSLFL